MNDDFNDDLDFGVNLQNNDAIQQQQSRKQPVKTSPSQQKPVQSPRSVGSNGNMGQNSIGKSDYDLSLAAHPTICIATFAFKAAALFMQIISDSMRRYFPLGYFLSTIIMFILVLVLSAMDFWTVKNVTGRILVGLRWRSIYNQNGKQEWIFESYDKQYVCNKVDKAFFWGSQGLFTIIWGFFLFINILGLNLFNGTLVFICAALCFTNFYGFYKCRGDHHKKLKDLKSKYGTQGLMKIAGNFM